MINLAPDETIIRVIHRHPWMFGVRSALSFATFIFPLALFFVLRTLIPSFVYPLTNLYWIAYCIYALFVFFFFILMCINHYLDFWIITSKKIIDVEFRGIFDHEVSEFSLEKIQDVTVHLQGLMPIFLDYGNISIKTASETLTLNMHEVPHPTAIKDTIMTLLTAPNIPQEPPAPPITKHESKPLIP